MCAFVQNAELFCAIHLLQGDACKIIKYLQILAVTLKNNLQVNDELDLMNEDSRLYLLNDTSFDTSFDWPSGLTAYLCFVL